MTTDTATTTIAELLRYDPDKSFNDLLAARGAYLSPIPAEPGTPAGGLVCFRINPASPGTLSARIDGDSSGGLIKVASLQTWQYNDTADPETLMHWQLDTTSDNPDDEGLIQVELNASDSAAQVGVSFDSPEDLTADYSANLIVEDDHQSVHAEWPVRVVAAIVDFTDPGPTDITAIQGETLSHGMSVVSSASIDTAIEYDVSSSLPYGRLSIVSPAYALPAHGTAQAPWSLRILPDAPLVTAEPITVTGLAFKRRVGRDFAYRITILSRQPEIVLFHANGDDRATLNPGDKLTLEWTVNNATRLELAFKPSPGVIDGLPSFPTGLNPVQGTQTVQITTRTWGTYTLTATNDTGSPDFPGLRSSAQVLITSTPLHDRPSYTPPLAVSQPVDPAPDEACGFTALDPQYVAPSPLLIDSPQNEWRLVPMLRAAAQTRDPFEILSRSAAAFFWATHPMPFAPTQVHAQALADLSVTGRAAFEAFRGRPPSKADLQARVQQMVHASPAATPGEVATCVDSALHRAASVATALRGPLQGQAEARHQLGYIAVSGEDDPPHRPVNVPTAPYPQYDLAVPCGSLTVQTRYMIAPSAPDPAATTLDGDGTVLAADPNPWIPDQDAIILFIHGHSSRLEECLALVEPIQTAAKAQHKYYSIVAMDLPCCGYSSMFDHAQIADPSASQYPAGYPILDFIENFIVSFVDTLDRRVPIKDRIAGVIGGSLGGNMCLRLARRDLVQYPWLRYIVAWSPASVWNAFVGADPLKAIATKTCQSRMREIEQEGSRRSYFSQAFDSGFSIGPLNSPPQPQMWYRDDWTPCKSLSIQSVRNDRRETYNQWLRRWHWRVALEQLIFSHRDPPDDPRYKSIKAATLLAAGQKDDYQFAGIYSATRDMAGHMTNTPGRTLFLNHTGHSIHSERPNLLAHQIVNFL